MDLGFLGPFRPLADKKQAVGVYFTSYTCAVQYHDVCDSEKYSFERVYHDAEYVKG